MSTRNRNGKNLSKQPAENAARGTAGTVGGGARAGASGGHAPKWFAAAGVLLSALAVAVAGGGQRAAVDASKKTTLGAAAENEAETSPAVVLMRRSKLSDEDLRKQLLQVPETGFGQGHAALIYKPPQTKGKLITDVPPEYGPKCFQALTAQAKAPEQFALPWRVGPDCALGKEEAERLHVLSRYLRDCLRKAAPSGDIRPDAEKLKNLIAANKDLSREWKNPTAIPTLMQLLQAENTPIRLLLVEMLADIRGKEASAALARRALFDLSAEAREKAVQALAKRPAEEYQMILAEGLRYPWPAAADHAAEAISALRLTATVPDLVGLLKEPAPTAPFKQKDSYFVKELVRINHLSNCLLCHAPSFAEDDLIRGHVPIPGEVPPPVYYNATTGLFVRANTTYLRQEFSVYQPVENNGKWQANQRYDYLARFRPLSPNEMKVVELKDKKDLVTQKYPQRDAVLFALRELTKLDVGDDYESWAKELPKFIEATKDKPKGPKEKIGPGGPVEKKR